MLRANNLEVVYDDVVLALRGVSLTVPAGEIIALLGSNGAGKTTLLRALTGLLDIHHGEITKGGVSLDDVPTHRWRPERVVAQGVRQVLEGRRVFVELSVEDNLKVGAHTARASMPDNLDRVFGLFPVLAERRTKTAGYLSGGEQQMLAMGRALMSDPRFLLLDEPSLGLSPKLVEQVRDVIVEINQAGTGMLLVEQNATMALSIATHGYVMETGRIVLDKPAESLLKDDDVREFYLGLHPGDTRGRRPRSTLVPRRQALPAQEAVVRVTSPVVSLRDVHLSFAGVNAISGATFEVMPGELFAIIGPNGAGKTSLFNVLSGVYRPQQGSVEFLGESILGERPHRIAARGMARTFQNIALFEHLTVLDNLMLGRHQHIGYGFLSAFLWRGRARNEELANRRVVEEIVDFLELEQWRSQPVGLLPYGVQKRVELGRALAMEPKLLLLDEPVAGMNLEETEDTARYILDIRDELDVPIIMVEHDMGLVMDLADRVMVVDFGVPITTGTPDEVQRHPDVIRAYLGQEVGT